MNDDTLDCMLSGINALDLNTSEVFKDNQNKLSAMICELAREQMQIDDTTALKSIRSVTGSTRGYTVVDDPVSTNQSYFDSLREKLCIAITNKIVKGDLSIKTLVADLLKFCSDEEIDELIACITSDSEYLSRKGYNSINLKGD